jgi:hypothetical protein
VNKPPFPRAISNCSTTLTRLDWKGSRRSRLKNYI